MRRFVKRILLALMLALLTVMSAQAETGSILLFDARSGQWTSDSWQKVAAIGDTLYISRMEGLYSFRLTDETPSLLMDFSKTDISGAPLTASGAVSRPSVDALLAENGILYTLDIIHGMLWQFDPNASFFTKQASFDLRDALPDQDNHFFSNFCMAGGGINFTALNTHTAVSSLMRLDTKTGDLSLLRSGVWLAVPYAPGVLLAAGTFGQTEALALLDTRTGALEERLKLDAGYKGMYYAPETDTVYLWHQGEIRAIKSFSPPKTVARMPILRPVSGGALLEGDYLALPYEDGVRIYSTDPKNLMDKPLKIGGQTMDLPMEDFSISHPDIPLSIMNIYPESTMDLVTHMTGGDAAADVYVLDARTYRLDALDSKGYFADLSGSEAIRDTVQIMYPFMRDALMKDGQTMALPFANKYTVHSFNRRAFEEVGLDEADVPTTYGELLTFIQKWPEEYAEDYPSMSLFGQGVDAASCKLLLIDSILTDRVYECLRKGEAITYNTPQMRELLAQFAATDFSAILPLTPDRSHENGEDANSWPKQLFLLWGQASAQASLRDGSFTYMPLRLSCDAEPVILAEAQILLINPYTQNFNAALTFVEFAAQHLPPLTRVEIMPGENGPVPDPTIDLSMTQINIDAVRKALETAKEEDKRSLQSALEMWQQQYDYELANAWLATPESIAAFRKLDPYFMLQQYNPITSLGANAELVDMVYNRFLGGQLSPDQLIRELDQKLRMIELEN